MASPLQASSAKGNSRASSSVSTARRRQGRNELLQRRTRNEKLADARTFVSDSGRGRQGQASGRNMLGRGRLLRSLDTSSSQPVKKAQAVIVGSFIIFSTLPFYIPQVLFWVLGLGGIAVESVAVVNWFAPGEELFLFSYLMIAIFGSCTMMYATIMFNIRGVDCFGGKKSLYFILCLTGYFTFFLNLAPWTIIWVLSVMFNQSNPEEET